MSQLAVWDEEIPLYVPLQARARKRAGLEVGAFNFQRWLAQCRERGYTAWVARDGSHAIAVPSGLLAHDQHGRIRGQHLDDHVGQGAACLDRVARLPVRHGEAADADLVAGNGDQPEPVARHGGGGYR